MAALYGVGESSGDNSLLQRIEADTTELAKDLAGFDLEAKSQGLELSSVPTKCVELALADVECLAKALDPTPGPGGNVTDAWRTWELDVIVALWSAALGLMLLLAAVLCARHRRLLARFSRGEGGCNGESTRQLPEAKSSVSLAFTEVTYEVGGERILDRITGQVLPGEILAIMGPSGCGKTTMLELIAGRRTPKNGKMSGRVLVNGRDDLEAQQWFRDHSAYQMQLAENYLPTLTVRENLAYAALLRLPAAMSEREKLARVDLLLHELELSDIAHLRAGSSMGGGISGGQKRKLSMAIEMMRLPSLLLLDEPTSGLDTTSSVQVVRALRRYCGSSRSVVLTIHQPRSDIFSSFDKLQLLFRGGTAFFGAPADAVETLTGLAQMLQTDGSIDGLGSMRLQTGTNPADVVLDLLNHEARVATENGNNGVGKPHAATEAALGVNCHTIGYYAVAMYRLSGRERALQSQIQQSFAATERVPLDAPHECTACASILTRILILESRRWRARRWRDILAAPACIAMGVSVASSLFWQVGTIQSAYGAMYLVRNVCSNIWVGLVAVDDLYSSFEGTYQLESAAGLVAPLTFITHHLIGMTGLMLLSTAPAYVTIYISTMPPPLDLSRLYFFSAISVFEVFTAQVLCFLFTTLCYWLRCPRQTGLAAAVSIWGICTTLFSGFFLSLAAAPFCWKGAIALSAVYWSTTAIARVVLTGLDMHVCRASTLATSAATLAGAPGGAATAALTERLKCEYAGSGDYQLAQLGYSEVSVARSVGVMLLMSLACLCGAWACLEYEVRGISPIEVLRHLFCSRRRAAFAGRSKAASASEVDGVEPQEPSAGADATSCFGFTEALEELQTLASDPHTHPSMYRLV